MKKMILVGVLILVGIIGVIVFIFEIKVVVVV